MSTTSPEGSHGAPSVDTEPSPTSRTSDTSESRQRGGSSTTWSMQSDGAEQPIGSEPSPLAGVTAEMRNMAKTAAAKAQSVAQSTRTSTTATKTVPAKTKARAKGPRRVRLAVARVDPWSVMKMSFLLSVAVGIAGVVLTGVLWMILSTMNVFTDIEGVLQGLQSTTQDPFSIKDYVGFGRVVSLSIVIGVIDVILMTAIATVMAFLYNIASALVGGVQLTLTDD